MKEELRQKYEDAAWNTTTRFIEICLKGGHMNEAKRMAQKTIEDWEAEDKPEVIRKFKEWLKARGMNLDEN